MNIIWDYKDDYYFVSIDEDIEINIRVYKDSILVWIYDYNKDIEILDETYNSLDEAKNKISKILNIDIKLPNIIELKRIEAR
jgi:hypothetical protein